MKDKGGLKKQRCMACGRTLEPVKVQWAAGPVCYACWWAAKFYYENGWNGYDDIPQEFATMLGGLFRKNGYLYPDDLIEAFKTKPFRKASTMMRRWWSPKFHIEDELDLAAGYEVSLNPDDMLAQGTLL